MVEELKLIELSSSKLSILSMTSQSRLVVGSVNYHVIIRVYSILINYSNYHCSYI